MKLSEQNCKDQAGNGLYSQGSGVRGCFSVLVGTKYTLVWPPFLCLRAFALFPVLFLRLPSLFPSYINASLVIPSCLGGNACHFPANIHPIQAVLTIFKIGNKTRSTCARKASTGYCLFPVFVFWTRLRADTFMLPLLPKSLFLLCLLHLCYTCWPVFGWFQVCFTYLMILGKQA